MGSAAVEQDSRAATYLTLVLMKLTLVTLTWAHHGTQASNEFPTINVLKEEFAKHAKTSKMLKRPWCENGNKTKTTLVTLTLTL